jgi:glyoxylase-like metal-dependent hydrolase (beta-lactamase superfamily II)
MSRLETQSWRVGAATITSVVEEQIDHVPPGLFLPDATPAAVCRHAWLVPDYADAKGNIHFRVQAFVIDVAGRRIMVDPCVGNGKTREFPFWNNRQWPFLDRLQNAGFTTDGIDLVVHTHLHADHVGWDTRLVDGQWVPTFTRARHLYTQRELDYCRTGGHRGNAGVWADSIAPIFDAGLADIVEEDADLGSGLRLEPTSGHTPGHVSLWIESQGERALITGDVLHHPVQLAEPSWREVADVDAERARESRYRLFASAAASNALVLGTHFPTRPAGRVQQDGAVWRFVAEP